MTLAEKFDNATRGKGMPVIGVCILGNSKMEFQHVVERKDGIRVRIDFEDGASLETINEAIRAVREVQV